MRDPVLAAPGIATHRSARARFSRAVGIVTAIAVTMLGAVVVAPAAQADGALQFSAAVDAPASAL